ncbi:MAG: hypothetical protein ACLFSQ_10780 [Candidatus Zixiibacteriota bacterium]
MKSELKNILLIILLLIATIWLKSTKEAKSKKNAAVIENGVKEYSSNYYNFTVPNQTMCCSVLSVFSAET